jgi:hypothetical protein
VLKLKNRKKMIIFSLHQTINNWQEKEKKSKALADAKRLHSLSGMLQPIQRPPELTRGLYTGIS